MDQSVRAVWDRGDLIDVDLVIPFSVIALVDVDATIVVVRAAIVLILNPPFPCWLLDQ